ncbi:MAG: hypothetical protein KDK40_03020 [Chlamydiia bacterium]|nr:hypothetical protein [Chlamydiia bacterium]
MKIINEKCLVIPPYISTGWAQVESLSMANDDLLIHLKNGHIVRIPKVDAETIQESFEAHARYLAKHDEPVKAPSAPNDILSSFQGLTGQFTEMMESFLSAMPEGGSVKFGPIPMSGIENIAHLFQHDQSLSLAPDVPLESLEQMAKFLQEFGENSPLPELLGKPEPHCNCPHCQVCRFIHHGEEGRQKSDSSPTILNNPQEDLEDESDPLLRKWSVISIGDQIFRVISRENPSERYQVFLGERVGCTCGDEGCEHLIAVLRS